MTPLGFDESVPTSSHLTYLNRTDEPDRGFPIFPGNRPLRALYRTNIEFKVGGMGDSQRTAGGVLDRTDDPSSRMYPGRLHL